MPLGSMNHIGLTVSDMARSTAFYDRLLTRLGYERNSTEPEMVLWVGAAGFSISPARPELAQRPHDRYAVGLHHFAFDAPRRGQVDEIYAELLEMGAEILDPPAEYDYEPGYYAVFFLDPDGIKLEVTHIPGFSDAAPQP